MGYNYFEAVCDDVREVIVGKWADRFAEFENFAELREALNDELWALDTVTGNASGTYTFSPWKAEEYLAHNWGVLEEACSAFGADVGEVVKKGAENADVLIRRYYLGAAIDKVLPDFEKYFNAAHEEVRDDF
jgi:hypothetical protein